MEDLVIERFEKVIKENRSKCKIITDNHERYGVHKNQKKITINFNQNGEISSCVIIDATND